VEEVSGDHLKQKRRKKKIMLKKFWNCSNERLLKDYVLKHGKHWSKIAKLFNNKNITPLAVK